MLDNAGVIAIIDRALSRTHTKRDDRREFMAKESFIFSAVDEEKLRCQQDGRT
jgi:hypothetical protein